MQELNRHLLSLAHPNVRVLRKNPNNNTMAPDHKFMFNTKYESKLYRVKVRRPCRPAAMSRLPAHPSPFLAGPANDDARGRQRGEGRACRCARG